MGPVHAVPPQAPAIPVTLALEGGGPLGAFTWGVLDRLVDTPSLHIGAVSGTSAGAMNAAMLVQGLATGGPAAAKRLLETFWRRVALASGSLPEPMGAWLHLVTGTVAPMMDAMRQTAAAWMPGVGLGYNPLHGILTELLDPAMFARPGAPALVVAATCVRTGEARLFRGAAVTVDVLLASACLPQLFAVVEIDGEDYWDGGYTSNPPICPLVEAGAPPDVLVVRTTPLQRPRRPLGPTAILERVNEITFGAALRSELRSLAQTQALLTGLPDLPTPLARLRDARVHMIGAEPTAYVVPNGSQQDPTWSFLAEMRGLGHQTADGWIAQNLHAVGQHSTLDLARFIRFEADGGAGQVAA